MSANLGSFGAVGLRAPLARWTPSVFEPEVQKFFSGTLHLATSSGAVVPATSLVHLGNEWTPVLDNGELYFVEVISLPKTINILLASSGN